MSAATGRFNPTSDADVTRLVLEHPFAWLVTVHAQEFAATPLPLRPVLDDRGSITALLGHFARSNPHVELLRRSPRTLVLFLGPHGYVSSSWFADRTRTPTWNYAAAQYLVDIEFTEDARETEAVLRDLIGEMEGGRPQAWSLEEMGPRYPRLVSGIIAFRARILERRVKFKLGQDERDAEFFEITRALAAAGDDELHDWMRRCNPTRGGNRDGG